MVGKKLQGRGGGQAEGAEAGVDDEGGGEDLGGQGEGEEPPAAWEDQHQPLSSRVS